MNEGQEHIIYMEKYWMKKTGGGAVWGIAVEHLVWAMLCLRHL